MTICGWEVRKTQPIQSITYRTDFTDELAISEEIKPNNPNKSNRKVVVLILLAIAIGLFWVFFRQWLTIENLVSQETAIRVYFDSNPTVIFVAAFLIYVLVAAIALPGAALLSLVYAWFFGIWPA